jgi:hypothetical protein
LFYCIFMQFCTISLHWYVLYLWLSVIIYLLIQKKKQLQISNEISPYDEPTSYAN